MSQVMEHVHQLAGVIGPRPATTDAEAQAADYIEDVFQARGLDVERQEFDCPRTYSWTYVIYHVLTIGGAVLSLLWSWPAFALSAVAAVALWFDLDTRFSISRFLPRGPSQNIIARHVPRQRRGEKLKRVVIVAHYDSAKSSLAFSPGLVKNFNTTFTLMKVTTFVTPVVVLFGALPFAAAWKPWTAYAAMASAAYLIVPLFINVHRELFMHATDGANDNASGVAAMLGVMEATVPESDEAPRRARPIRRGAEAAYEADVVPADTVLEYRDVTAAPAEGVTMPFDGFGDVGWETGPVGRTAPTVTEAGGETAEWAAGEEPEVAGTRGDRPPAPDSDWLSDSDSDVVWEERGPRPAYEPSRDWTDEGEAEGQESLDLAPEGDAPVGGRLAPDSAEEEPPSRERRSREGEEHRGIRDWLGVGRGFDVRRAGQRIGSWDNLDAEEEDDFGFKAGTAGDPDASGELLTSEEVSRIRRRVTESVDRALSEKEIWFVATGAEEAGTWGMRALLDAYPDELRDALIINIDNVGAGVVAYVTDEGMAKRYRADRRLVAQAKRTARENGLSVKGQSYRGLSTDATPALARRFKAMSVMAFDINGRLPDWHWETDTEENVSATTVEAATTFVTALLRDL